MLKHRSIIIRTLLLVGLAVLAASTAPVFAQLNFDPNIPTLPRDTDPQTKIGNLIIGIINALLALAAVLAVGAIIWGAVVFIVSVGDEKRVQKAKTIIFWAIVGLILTGFSFLIVRFVGQLLGAGGAGPAGEEAPLEDPTLP